MRFLAKKKLTIIIQKISTSTTWKMSINFITNITCHSLVEQQKRKLAQLEEIEKEAAEKEPSRYLTLLKVKTL